MAVYKVAQDVEADDKLLGPFTFRQFIYLIIVAIAGALAFGLSQIFIGLIIIPMPIILFFGALALPLRKDQPMEIYLAALVAYYLKPRRRLWIADGIESLIEITAPKTVEVQRAKDISETEAERRLSYLADIADTEGWAVRHVAQPIASNSMITDAYFEAQQTEDVLDSTGAVAQSLSAMIDQADTKRHQDMVNRIQQAAQQPTAPQPIVPPMADPYAALTTAPTTPPPTPTPTTPQYNPYPNAIHQSIIQPLGTDNQAPATPVSPTPPPAKDDKTAPTTSEKNVSPDIINLANNSDLSIETIQREANRIQQKAEAEDGEVFISLH